METKPPLDIFETWNCHSELAPDPVDGGMDQVMTRVGI